MLGVMHAKNFLKWAEGAQLRVRRRLGEAPRRAREPPCPVRVLALDLRRQGDVRVLYSDIDRAGQLWKVWVNDFSFRKAFSGADTTYPTDMPFLPAIIMADMQPATGLRRVCRARAAGGRAGSFNKGGG